ncbi:apolipoprotein M-like [Scyliorhinus torazame]|uniref:apolipoprotein M-like n=1 Tax=Scyliorhinus torazame TaxID=75743 RepID=UPI003B599DB9
MFQQLWKTFLCLVLLLRQCEFQTLLPTGILSTAEYSGKWFILGVAADTTSLLVSYNELDSAVFMFTPMEGKQMLQMKGALRLTQSMQCMPLQWIYQVNKETQKLEGEFLRTSYIIAVDPNSSYMLLQRKKYGLVTFARLILYGRSPKLTESHYERFQQVATSMRLDKVVALRQAQAPCEI